MPSQFLFTLSSSDNYLGVLIIPSTYYVFRSFLPLSPLAFHNFSSEHNYVRALRKKLLLNGDDEDPFTSPKDTQTALEKDE